jgi:glycosyltransferase involved in cell wall biosynthesis
VKNLLQCRVNIGEQLMRHESDRRRNFHLSPLVSIIIVVFEAISDLPNVIESILQHKDDDLELIIIDGGSRDGTVEYLRAHESQIDYWISEKDSGIYDAMNKGISNAQGVYLLHLNAGDRLLRFPKAELQRANADGVDIAAFRVSIDGKQEFHPSSGIGLRFTNTLHHQGTFFRRERFLTYDLRYRVFADFDVNQKLALSGARMKVFDSVVALHANDGISNRDSEAIEAEFFSVIQENYGRWAILPAWIVRKWHGLLIMLRN